MFKFLERFITPRPRKYTTGTPKTRRKVFRRNKNRELRGEPIRRYGFLGNGTTRNRIPVDRNTLDKDKRYQTPPIMRPKHKTFLER